MLFIEITFFDLKSDVPKININVMQLFHKIFKKFFLIFRSLKVDMYKKLNRTFQSMGNFPPLTGLKHLKSTCIAIP